MSERERVRDEREEAVEARPEGYDRIESELLKNSLDLEREAERFKAMGESTRFTLLYLLAQEGQIGSGELADLLDRRQNDLYHHLNTLEDAGLVGKFRDGQTRVYELSPLAEAFVPQIFEAISTRAEAV
ncbi:helix-turn-helix transcriptional regulator [Halorubrum sp. Atlit-28R]|jgi:DNA-binding transcriptional ArsR family regulator|uniref:ArsR/SmtB family transcription factor n=1 Tax=Halorubrum sp. Atlit-28R TaxID=2282129 RepID=UPI000EF23D4A|nr:metalloregulator ArsR/SmtB family transcription factor [Halorubrum sp. Atlit-28R]RLM49904.1 ArsR family transcriptional regulator [Halorubrum sp. Atlit-28R]